MKLQSVVAYKYKYNHFTILKTSDIPSKSESAQVCGAVYLTVACINCPSRSS